MDRRQFVKGAASAIVLGPTLLQLGACGDDESTAADGGGGNAGTQGNTSGTGAGAGSGAGNGTAGTSTAGTGSADKDGSVLADGSVGDDSGMTLDAGGGNPTLDASMDSSVADTSMPVCPSGATATTITSNHGHSLTVSNADVVAAIMKNYDIQGAAGHAHNITLTPAHFATLAAGGSVTVSTTSGPHPHDVTVECA